MSIFRNLVPILFFSSVIFTATSFLPFAEEIPRTLNRQSATNAKDDDLMIFRSSDKNHSDFIWPTDASTRITSSFAEYRSTHFHGGIDISTNGQPGFKVFAVQDGFVSHIRITPNGYGKMLFVKHHNGYVSSYAHLQKFNDTITHIARKEQYRRGTYAIDVALDSSTLPVKQGDIIAYSGDTGFGPPHLHFEMRDEQLNPINPMLFETFRVDDQILPRIRRLMISPLEPNSSIDGQPQSRYLSRFPRSKGMFRIPQVIQIHGSIGLGIEVQDRTDDSWSKSGIYSLELYLDDSLTFSSQLDRIPAEDTKQIHLHYSLSTILQGYGKFQKLYIEQGNTLPLYNGRSAGSGIINTFHLREGEHQFKILCKDISGNSTELHGTFLVNHTPTLRITQVNENEICVIGEELSSIEKYYVFGKKNSETAWTQHTLSRGRFETKFEGVTLPVKTTKYDIVKIIAETKWGSKSPAKYQILKKPKSNNREMFTKTDILNGHIQLTATTVGVFTTTPIATIREGNTTRSIELDAQDLSKYVGIFVPSDNYFGESIIRIDAEVDGNPARAEEKIDLYSIPTNRSGSFKSHDGQLTFFFDSSAVFEPLHMQIHQDTFHRNMVYSLEPQDILLNRGITVAVSENTNAEGNHVGLYFRSNGGWIFQSSRQNPITKMFSTTLTRTLGDLALLQDDVGPTIGRLKVYPRKGFVYIAFRYHDNLSGVDTDEIKLYLDHNLVIPEIDGEHRRVWYMAERPLERGNHKLHITLKDQMKNETEITRNFTVR
ncbi:MAG TPA: M23 family metallopeptidase [Bacteroidota bacterium]|nr:M23 family metallopeptidase [Bacteroidota bacterium]